MGLLDQLHETLGLERVEEHWCCKYDGEYPQRVVHTLDEAVRASDVWLSGFVYISDELHVPVFLEASGPEMRFSPDLSAFDVPTWCFRAPVVMPNWVRKNV